MELLEGEPLSEHLRRGPMSVDQALPIAVDMLAALGAIHASGIVHRDLKPSNVFLARHGVKLLDFGLARPEMTAMQDSLDGLTRPGTVLGTPGYMAPELIPADFDADVAELEKLLGDVATDRRDRFGHLHPIFGRMSESAWLRWAYLQADHHFRQFGV